ncbi:DUF3037 domain-containing protein [Mesorhizobium sp. M7A.F.Ca.US.014.04.1.1]|uniref:DUF3037 domain-containing protein n=1 Tax=Mesorhizobium TaxID=68287 RepID=UPI0007A956E3|nr:MULTISPECIES: DUF3037 domain-containing protein [Mesorhizobium]AMX93258.1 hypothetical protein A4R28_09245 [Mesorhizobium ciceri]MDF3207925.1 DUF3037 domain-containing protein [Mesorhizobium sp. LMG15046]MDF3229503.1 DUF3037 domain-containing protein [Mesorhizobium sp. DSM 30133]RUU22597.1 DUF3037 domain-containing protein [Mesorhizobium sp. Primo-B]RUU35938.1 DUF3037 domain-containing protein [Mesorhizobium sp. Primo-A]
MSDRHPYNFIVLRYVHDIVTGEFVNVGVILHVSREGILRWRTRKTIGRIKSVFPDLDREAFVAAMRSVERGMRGASKMLPKEGLFRQDRGLDSYAKSIVPNDDSSLQWSPVSSGVTNDPSKTFERLYERFVGRYDVTVKARKTDEDIWRPVRTMLAERNLNVELEKKVLSSKADSIEFKHAWKNGSWHAYEPLSLDLADADGIKDKVRRWRGHLAAVADDAQEPLKLHFIVGAPENRQLMPVYKNALEILRGSPFAPEIVEETQIASLVDEIEDEVRSHNQRI